MGFGTRCIPVANLWGSRHERRSSKQKGDSIERFSLNFRLSSKVSMRSLPRVSHVLRVRA